MGVGMVQQKKSGVKRGRSERRDETKATREGKRGLSFRRKLYMKPDSSSMLGRKKDIVGEFKQVEEGGRSRWELTE